MNGYTKNNGNVLESITDIVDTILCEGAIEQTMKIILNRVPDFFPGSGDTSCRITFNDKEWRSDIFIEKGTVLESDISIKGKKEGSVEVYIQEDNSKDDPEQKKYNKRTLDLICGMLATNFQKRSEISELRSREKAIRNACNNLEDYVFILDQKGNIIDSNTNFQTCIGYTEDELHKMNIRDILTYCSVGSSEFPLIEDAVKNGNSTMELDHRCKNGDVVPMNIICKPLEESGNLRSFLCQAKDISEKRKNRSELQESESKYSTIVEKGNDGILIIQDKIIRFANSRLLSITGYAADELIGEEYLKMVSPEFSEIPFDIFSDPYIDMNDYSENIFNINLLKKDKHTIPVEISVSIIDYEGMKAELLIIRDISERKRAEELIKKERDRLMNFLDVAGSIIGIVNSDMEVIFVNKKGAEVLGCSKDEIIGKNWFDNFLPPSVREITKENYIKVINNEMDPPQYFENFVITKDGEERLIFWHDVPFEDENGKRIGVISSGEDITEIRRMEARLIESEKNLKTIFDHVDDHIYIYRPYGKFMDVNRAAITSMGYSKEEMFEMSLEDIIIPDMRGTLNDHTSRVMKDKSVIFEICSVRRDGSLLPLELNSRYIEYKGEQAILSVARDITERKKAEKRLKQYTGELKQSNELKDLFTDIIRHDLLTPASVVKGYTEELIDNIENETALKLAEKVRENNDRLIELLETATKLAKLQKEEDIDFDEIDLTPLVRMVIDSFRTQLRANEQEVVLIGEGPHMAIANPVIEEVFSNLLSNAIKYSSLKNRIDIIFTDEGDMWKISVSDQGIGVPDSDKPLLFNRFHRADKKGIKGTGLGLAIVKRIIELHSGKYGVEDNPHEQGSVFWVMLKKA